jgi:hypothetical protein
LVEIGTEMANNKKNENDKKDKNQAVALLVEFLNQLPPDADFRPFKV